MTYAEGAGWRIDIVRDPHSGGFRVDITRGEQTRKVGQLYGYARRETAERVASNLAERLWDKEEAR